MPVGAGRTLGVTIAFTGGQFQAVLGAVVFTLNVGERYIVPCGTHLTESQLFRYGTNVRYK